MYTSSLHESHVMDSYNEAFINLGNGETESTAKFQTYNQTESKRVKLYKTTPQRESYGVKGSHKESKLAIGMHREP